MLHNQPKIKSIFKNNIKVLLWMPGSNIQDFHFSGLNFARNEGVDPVYEIDDLFKFKSNEYDYFFIHGYQLRGFDVDIFNILDIKIKNFCIDILGEGFDIDTFLRTDFTKESASKLDSKIKILIPFNHYAGLENEFPSYEFFKTEFGGPRIFCSRYNTIMIHGTYLKTPDGIKCFRYSTPEERIEYLHLYNEIVYGLKWSDLPKEKLFMCLIGTGRPHRICMLNSLIENNLLDFGYVTFKSNETKHIVNFSNENEEIFKQVEFELPHLSLDENLFEDRFSLHRPLSRNSYVELVVESSHTKMPFKTEKCVKPFYNLQFPLILGHEGIVEDLRKMDFDMFDDIIDHTYDTFPVKSTISMVSEEIDIKTEMISKELLKLNKRGVHNLYIRNKERFLYNQENLYKKTITENNIFQELGKFIFGDDIEVNEYEFDKIEKLIL
jgi:hypothetical protein